MSIFQYMYNIIKFLVGSTNNYKEGSMANKKFTTKAYTINLLISEVKALPSSKVKNFDTLVAALSPRAGKHSAKVKVLDSFLYGNLKSIVNTSSSNVKRNVLTALKNRKKFGN